MVKILKKVLTLQIGLIVISNANNLERLCVVGYSFMFIKGLLYHDYELS